VEMEFGLGEFAEEECDFLTGGHEHSLAGTRESKSNSRGAPGRRMSDQWGSCGWPAFFQAVSQ
jgi:hypothetical protein